MNGRRTGHYRIGLLMIAALTFAVAACEVEEGQDSNVLNPTGPTATAGPSPTPVPTTVAPTPPPSATVTDSGLQMVDLTVGTGAEATSESTVTVHYTGTLLDGTQFDTSRDGEPVTFELAGNLIEGWKEGVPGMKAGGKRQLIIPPELAYGAEGRPGIPPNAWLVFEIELISVE